jgi:hypothetical protein
MLVKANIVDLESYHKLKKFLLGLANENDLSPALLSMYDYDFIQLSPQQKTVASEEDAYLEQSFPDGGFEAEGNYIVYVFLKVQEQDQQMSETPTIESHVLRLKGDSNYVVVDISGKAKVNEYTSNWINCSVKGFLKVSVSGALQNNRKIYLKVDLKNGANIQIIDGYALVKKIL